MGLRVPKVEQGLKRMAQKHLEPSEMQKAEQQENDSLPNIHTRGGKSIELQSHDKLGPAPTQAKSMHKPAQGIIFLGFNFLVGKVWGG